METAFIYTDAYLDYDYGPTQPLRIVQLKMTYELIKACGLLDLPTVQFIPTAKAEEKDLATFHSREHLNILKESNDGRLTGNAYSYGFGPGDNLIFSGLYDWSLWVAGATLQAVDFVANKKGKLAFNIAGGLQ
jgi:acetoin utilization protein AcuC